MSQPELLIKVLSFLQQNGIDYMITGSVVSSIQGEPRSTHDIDIVVNLTKNNIPALTGAFTIPFYYLSPEAVNEAVESRFMFNLLDTSTGDKVDFWMLTDEDFDRERFKRKYEEHLAGFSMFVSTPEDTILMKLKWAKMSGGSEKQFTDARKVFEFQFINLNISYIEKWVTNLNLEEGWERLKTESNPLR